MQPNTIPKAAQLGFQEDLAVQAEHQFRLAQHHCTGCHEYHALWGYVRLAGIINGPETDRNLIENILGQYAPEGARILIAGAADAGLLAMTAEAAWSKGPRLAVADRCATPLLSCSDYAERRGFAIDTFQSDLAETFLAGPFDVVLAHYTLRYVPERLRAAFLRRLGESLAERGVLVLVHRDKSRKSAGGDATRGGDFSQRFLAALLAKSIALPESEARFRQRLEVYANARNPREGNTADVSDIEALLSSASLTVRERFEHERRHTISAWDGAQAAPMSTGVFIASRQQ